MNHIPTLEFIEREDREILKHLLINGFKSK